MLTGCDRNEMISIITTSGRIMIGTPSGTKVLRNAKPTTMPVTTVLDALVATRQRESAVPRHTHSCQKFGAGDETADIVVFG
jgi:hypothetical protein